MADPSTLAAALNYYGNARLKRREFDGGEPPTLEGLGEQWQGVRETVNSALGGDQGPRPMMTDAQVWDRIRASGGGIGDYQRYALEQPVDPRIAEALFGATSNIGKGIVPAITKALTPRPFVPGAEAALVKGSPEWRVAALQAGRDAKAPAAPTAIEQATMSLAADVAPVAPVGKAAPVKRSTDLPDIAEMPAAEAIAVAGKEPHLIKAGEQSEGYYIGGPRDIGGKRGLTNIRKNYDNYVAADPRGADWYDRYRKAIRDVTGDDPLQNEWMAKLHGQSSAGVSPDSELAFALKENNGFLQGYDQMGHYPAQHEALRRAINAPGRAGSNSAGNPALLQLGEKTGEYARLVNPDQARAPGATGVNDFRAARNWGYTEASGADQAAAMTSAQHKFMDYETALSVDRANKAQVGGRNDWTGEKIQAAPWVRQKALAILEQRPAILKRHLAAGLSPEAAQAAAYEEAFTQATKTIGDFYPKHTAFATYESQPGALTGHLPGAQNAPKAQVEAYAADPRSSWALAPGARDAIYGGLRLGETGIAARVLPTQPMQGHYVSNGKLQQNPGNVARPLVGFEVGEGGTKGLLGGDRAMLDAGEHVRATIDAQDAGAAHKIWQGGRMGDSNSFTFPMSRAATPEEMLAVQTKMKPFGLGDVADTGQGITSTQFYPGAPKVEKSKRLAAALDSINTDLGTTAQRAKVDSVYAGLEDLWPMGDKAGAPVTTRVLEKLNVTPQMRAAFDQNPYIPLAAADRLARDKSWSKAWGPGRQGIENLRKIIAAGPGWIGRLEQAVKDGVLLPALAAGVMEETFRRGGQNEAPL